MLNTRHLKVKRVYRRNSPKRRDFTKSGLNLRVFRLETLKIESLYREELKLSASTLKWLSYFPTSITDVKNNKNIGRTSRCYCFFFSRTKPYSNHLYFIFLPICWLNFFKPILFVSKYFLKKILAFNQNMLYKPKGFFLLIELALILIYIANHLDEVKIFLLNVIFYFWIFILIIFPLLAYRYKIDKGVFYTLIAHLFIFLLIYALTTLPLCLEYLT